MFPKPLLTPDDLNSLKTAAESLPSLQYVFDAITLTRTKLEGKVPLLGFTGAPVSFTNFSPIVLLPARPGNVSLAVTI